MDFKNRINIKFMDLEILCKMKVNFSLKAIYLKNYDKIIQKNLFDDVCNETCLHDLDSLDLRDLFFNQRIEFFDGFYFNFNE